MSSCKYVCNSEKFRAFEQKKNVSFYLCLYISPLSPSLMMMNNIFLQLFLGFHCKNKENYFRFVILFSMQSLGHK